MSDQPLETTISAVTVFNDQARITRTGTIALEAGEHTLTLAQHIDARLDGQELDRAATDLANPPARPAGYSFSDLSRRGPRYRFPHTFSYYLRPAGADGCALEILVRGRWTMQVSRLGASKV